MSSIEADDAPTEAVPETSMGAGAESGCPDTSVPAAESGIPAAPRDPNPTAKDPPKRGGKHRTPTQLAALERARLGRLAVAREKNEVYAAYLAQQKKGMAPEQCDEEDEVPQPRPAKASAPPKPGPTAEPPRDVTPEKPSSSRAKKSKSKSKKAVRIRVQESDESSSSDEDPVIVIKRRRKSSKRDAPPPPPPLHDESDGYEEEAYDQISLPLDQTPSYLSTRDAILRAHRGILNGKESGQNQISAPITYGHSSLPRIRY